MLYLGQVRKEDSVERRSWDLGGCPEFMGGTRRAFMITCARTGRRRAIPWRGLGGGALYLNMYRASAKAKNLARDDRICCVLATPTTPSASQGAVYNGHARELSVEEVFADEVPEGLAWARNPGRLAPRTSPTSRPKRSGRSATPRVVSSAASGWSSRSAPTKSAWSTM